jgi:hypothetical protein
MEWGEGQMGNVGYKQDPQGLYGLSRMSYPAIHQFAQDVFVVIDLQARFYVDGITTTDELPTQLTLFNPINVVDLMRSPLS